MAEKSVESQMVRSLKLIPEFDESKVTEWFRRFEKKASEFAWPRDRWVGLVANMLKGKALEVYDRMSVEDLDDYEEFKADILRAYELRPEAYRLQFRNSKKRPGDSYLECARYVEESFEKRLASERTTTYRELKELKDYGAVHERGREGTGPSVKGEEIQISEGGSYVGRRPRASA